MNFLVFYRAQETTSYSLPWVSKDPDLRPSDEMRSKIGGASPITRFIRTLLTLLDTGAARPHLKYLSEFHSFLYDFAKLGEEETRFLISIQAISTLIDFYLKVINQSPDSNVSLIFLASYSSRFSCRFYIKNLCSCRMSTSFPMMMMTTTTTLLLSPRSAVRLTKWRHSKRPFSSLLCLWRSREVSRSRPWVRRKATEPLQFV